MTLKNTTNSYGSLAKTFHWLTALLILSIIPLGMIANRMAHDIHNPDIASTTQDILRTFQLFSLHKTLGVAIFFVALARILWALSQQKPALLNADKRLEAYLAETVHWLLYGSLLLVPLSGWIHHAMTEGFAPILWPFGQSLPLVPKDPHLAEIFAGLHLVLERVLMISLILHIAGALKHHFVDRDATLRRMLPGKTTLPMLSAEPHSLRPPLTAVALWAVAITIGATLGLYGNPNSAPAAQQAQLAPAAGKATSNGATSDWRVSDGTLDLTILQMGNQVQGRFADWNATITFDKTTASGPAGHVDVTITIASLELGTVSAQAMGADFFDTTTFPTAHFSGDITRHDTGYTATGPLTIRDKILPVTLEFDLIFDGDTAMMVGTLPIARLDFDIGKSMPDESSLGFGVTLNIALTATQTK